VNLKNNLCKCEKDVYDCMVKRKWTVSRNILRQLEKMLDILLQQYAMMLQTKLMVSKE